MFARIQRNFSALTILLDNHRVQKSWEKDNKVNASVELEFKDGYKQKVFPPYKFDESSIRYRCPCKDYGLPLKTKKGSLTKGL